MTRLLHLLSIIIVLFATPALAATGPLVLAAASLQESVTAAADRWAAKGHPRPVLSFAASSALARQAAVAPPVIGAVNQATGGWTVPMLVVVASTTAFLVLGVTAATVASRRTA